MCSSDLSRARLPRIDGSNHILMCAQTAEAALNLASSYVLLQLREQGGIDAGGRRGILASSHP